MTKITINRAPVLTLWASIVAERLGFERDEALSLARVVSGITAHRKAVSLGIVEPTPAALKALKNKPKPGAELTIALLGLGVPAILTQAGIRGVSKGEVSKPDAAERYLVKNFGERLAEARQAMAALAKSTTPAELARTAFRLYEQFRPAVPHGESGWGAKGELDLAKIRRLAD